MLVQGGHASVAATALVDALPSTPSTLGAGGPSLAGHPGGQQAAHTGGEPGVQGPAASDAPAPGTSLPSELSLSTSAVRAGSWSLKFLPREQKLTGDSGKELPYLARSFGNVQFACGDKAYVDGS